MTKEERVFKDTDIAIIGMDGKMPQADNLNEFWNNLINGRECITRNGRENEKFINAQGIMKGAEYFDNLFFEIPDSDAIQLDPQYRCILECAYHTLEDAGYGNADRDSDIGIFVGADETFYVWNNVFNKMLNQESVDRIGMFLENTLATRISYKLNLTGPSIVVRAACATSMVAVHMAIESLLNFDCSMALAGGVNIKWLESGYQIVDGMSSAYGQLRAYDQMGDGFVPGNGVGLLALKRLEDAIESRDHIYGIITGSSVVNDGRRKAGYHASSVEGEAEAIIRAMEVAERSPRDICCIEGHGTATPLGDSVEIRAIDQAYRYLGNGNYHCVLGSVKSNIGHLNTAAGVAGIMKAVLSLQNGCFPPSINYQQPNPELERIGGHLSVMNKAYPLPEDRIKIIGVSSFGFGGVNSHIIIEEPPEESSVANEMPLYILPISARTERSLLSNKLNVKKFVQSHPNDIERISYVLWYGREHFEFRAFYLCDKYGKLLYSSDDSQETRGKLLEKMQYRGLPEMMSLAEKWMSKENSLFRQKFENVPYKMSIPVYEFEKNKFFVPQIDIKNRKEHLGIIDGISDTRFELTKYLARQKKNILTVFFEEKNNQEEIVWNQIEEYWELLTKREKIFLETANLHFLHLDSEAENMVDVICKLCLQQFWIETGVFREERSRLLTEIESEIGANASATHFLQFIIRISETYGIVEINKKVISLLSTLDTNIKDMLKQKLEQLKVEMPDGYELMKLLVYCTEQYLEVFRGKKTGSQVLYPKGSYELLKGIKSNGTAETIYCKLAAEAVEKLIPVCDRTVTLLEIGAGTGELTDEVLKLLGNRRIKYYFTDIGASFLADYKKKLPDYMKDKVEFLKIDITRSLEMQKINSESVDIILGVNVIQATNNIMESMNNLLSVLKPGGILCMVQLYRIHNLQEMIFGLSPGWWNYKDDPMQREKPYFSYEGWVRFWEKCGIKNIKTLPQSGKEEQSNAMLLIGQKDRSEYQNPKQVNNEVEEKRKKELLAINKDIRFCKVKNYSKESIKQISEEWKHNHPDAELIGAIENQLENKGINQDTSVAGQLKNIIADILNLESITDDFIEEFDSLSLLMLIAEIEKKFGYKIEIEKMYSFTGMEELVADIERHAKVSGTDVEAQTTEEGSIELLFNSVLK